jgi:hypothetical protein
MTCAACEAPIAKGIAYCRICGTAASPGAGQVWDRRPEAAAFTDLQQAAGEDQPVIAFTRGKLVGAWKGRIASNPMALLTPYANLGLTAQGLLIEGVQPKSGEAISGKPVCIPFDQVTSIVSTNADASEPPRSMRLHIALADGEALRLKSFGRLAREASRLAETWRTLAGEKAVKVNEPEQCPHCHRPLDRAYAFCPFCGQPQEDV